MKLYFEAPTNSWAANPVNRKAWDGLMEKLHAQTPAGRLASTAAQADVIIHAGNEQLESSPPRQLLRPLSKSDVARLVWDWGDKPTGRYSGFYCSLPRRLFDPRRHRTASYPIEFNETVRRFEQEDAVYTYGLLGGATSGLRVRLFETLQDRAEADHAYLKLQGNDWSKAFERTGSPLKDEYAAFLAATRFVLCPKGYGVGSARMFETMKAGRVPVIISDDYVPPSNIDWASCSLAVAERDLETIPEVVARNLDRWPQMARAARAAWEANFSEASLVETLSAQAQSLLQNLPRTSLGLKLSHQAKITRELAQQSIRPMIGSLRRKLRGR